MRHPALDPCRDAGPESLESCDDMTFSYRLPAFSSAAKRGAAPESV